MDKYYKKMLNILNNGATLYELYSKGYKRGDVVSLVRKLKLDGYQLDYYLGSDNVLKYKTTLNKTSPYKEFFSFDTNKENMSIALISDTHIKNDYDFSPLTQMYNFIKGLEIQNVLLLGDVLDQELNHSKDSDENIEYCLREVDNLINNFPYSRNISTYYIKGGHDNRLQRNYEIDVTDKIINKRLDFIPLGSSTNTKAIIKVNNLTIALDHPRFSIKNDLYDKELTKYYNTENIDIILRGHLHTQKSYYYNNTLVFTLAPFIKASYNIPSFYVLKLFNNDSNITKFNITSYMIFNDKIFRTNKSIYNVDKKVKSLNKVYK